MKLNNEPITAPTMTPDTVYIAKARIMSVIRYSPEPLIEANNTSAKVVTIAQEAPASAPKNSPKISRLYQFLLAINFEYHIDTKKLDKNPERTPVGKLMDTLPELPMRTPIMKPPRPPRAAPTAPTARLDMKVLFLLITSSTCLFIPVALIILFSQKYQNKNRCQTNHVIPR